MDIVLLLTSRSVRQQHPPIFNIEYWLICGMLSTSNEVDVFLWRAFGSPIDQSTFSAKDAACPLLHVQIGSQVTH